jgi:hypothetical protein
MAKKATKSRKRTASKGGQEITVPVHSVVHFVKMLFDENHVDEFVKAAKKSKAVMTMHADSIEFVRKFLSHKELHHAMVKSVVDPCPGDPFKCHFRD